MTDHKIISIVELGQTDLSLGKFNEAARCFIAASDLDKLHECAQVYAEALITKKYYVYYSHIRGKEVLRQMLAACFRNGDAETAKVMQTQIRKYDIWP